MNVIVEREKSLGELESRIAALRERGTGSDEVERSNEGRATASRHVRQPDAVGAGEHGAPSQASARAGLLAALEAFDELTAIGISATTPRLAADSRNCTGAASSCWLR